MLQKHCVSKRSRRQKGLLAFVAQDADSPVLCYGNAQVRKANQNDEVLRLVKFWKEGTGKLPRELQLTLMGSSLYRLLGNEIRQGYEGAKSRTLFRDCVDAHATLDIPDKEMNVKFQKRAHNPLLLKAGFEKSIRPFPGLKTRNLIWSSDDAHGPGGQMLAGNYRMGIEASVNAFRIFTCRSACPERTHEHGPAFQQISRRGSLFDMTIKAEVEFEIIEPRYSRIDALLFEPLGKASSIW